MKIKVLIWSVFLLALLPFLLLLAMSFSEHDAHQLVIWHFTWKNYHTLIDPVFLHIVLRSVFLSTVCTTLCLLIAYPAALFLSQCSARLKPFLMLLLILPFWTSALIRTYALLALLKTKGLINTVLLALGLIHHPLPLLYNNTAVTIGVVYNLLPYMILPLYSSLEKLDHNLMDAARDLGANRFKILKEVILPLSLPGMVAGITLVFLPAMTLFYIPTLLGGAKGLLLGNLVENQFLSINDWPGGAATSMLLTGFMLLLMWLYRRTHQNKTAEGLL